jgi:hypothetical protein
MRKLVTLLFCIALCFTGCSADALSGYIKALKKTGSIPNGSLKFEATVDMDFNLNNLTANEIKSVKNLEHMEFSTETNYDCSNDDCKIIAQSYGNVGGVGVDSTLYIDGEEVNLHVPILGGYMDLSQADYQSEYEASEKFPQVFESVMNKFMDLLTQKDIMKGKRTYITTEDGQIKTTVYTVHLTEEQLKQLFEEAIRMIEQEDIDFEKITNIDMDDIDIPKEMNKWKDSFTLSDFSSTAYVDFDGRLVKQDMTADIAVKEEGASKGPVRIQVSAEITFSGLGEKQDLEYPEISQDMYLEEGWEKFGN